jgi:hypothetical protein
MIESLKLKNIVMLVFLLFPFAASAGIRDGGGGDPTEETVYEIRQSILDWIKSGEAKKLVFNDPAAMAYDKYVQLMTPVLIAPPSPFAVVVGFVTTAQENATSNPEQQVAVDGVAKACRWFNSVKDHRIHLLCNSDRFPESAAEQFRLIHHEFAGVAGVEKNLGASSDYEISNQLADFGGYVSVYKLGPRHKIKDTISCVDFDPAQLHLVGSEDTSWRLVSGALSLYHANTGHGPNPADASKENRRLAEKALSIIREYKFDSMCVNISGSDGFPRFDWPDMQFFMARGIVPKAKPTTDVECHKFNPDSLEVRGEVIGSLGHIGISQLVDPADDWKIPIEQKGFLTGEFASQVKQILVNRKISQECWIPESTDGGNLPFTFYTGN